MTAQSSEETLEPVPAAATSAGRAITLFRRVLDVAERLLLLAVGAVGGLVVGYLIALFAGWVEFRC